MNKEVTAYIAHAGDHHKDLLAALRRLIFSIVPDSKEQFKWGRPVYATENDYCYLKTTKQHVTLGFFAFDKITTNKDLIEGSGKSMRHIKLSQVSEIDEFQIKEMIEEALM